MKVTTTNPYNKEGCFIENNTDSYDANNSGWLVWTYTEELEQRTGRNLPMLKEVRWGVITEMKRQLKTDPRNT